MSFGPVAQLGARMTGSHEVRGSNPLRSINLQIEIVFGATLGQQIALALPFLCLHTRPPSRHRILGNERRGPNPLLELNSEILRTLRINLMREEQW